MLWFRRIWNSLFARHLHDEVEQELETHLAMLEEEAASAGFDPVSARASARKRFGSPALQASRARDMSSSIRLSEVLQDIRFAVRQIRKHPGFAAVAILITALGVSSVTTIFSLMDAVLFHSFPYRNPSELVYLWAPNPQFGANIPQEIGPNLPDALEWEAGSHSFSSMTMLRQHVFNLSRSGITVRTGGAIVTATFFRTLGVKPFLGRSFESFDKEQGHVVVISHRLWHRLFPGETSLPSQTLQLDRNAYRVIGVMPEEFGFPFEGDVPYSATGYGQTDLWLPMTFSAAARTDRRNPESTDAVIARLRGAASIRKAQLELASLEKRLDLLYPPELRGNTALVRSLRDTILGPVRTLLWILLAAVGAVLLIACGNVSNLLLARATARVEELTIRVSLGAGRIRLVRQLLTESVVLALTGCVIGIVLSLSGVRILLRMNPGNIPRFDETALNWPVLLVSVIVSILSGILFGLFPAVLASRTDLMGGLKKGGSKGSVRGSVTAGQLMIAAEVTLSFALLIAAGLLVHSYLRLQAQNPGYLRSTLTMNLQLDSRYSKPEQRRAIFLRYLERLRHIPGVLDAGAGSDIPLDNYESLSAIEVKGFGKPKDLIDARTITPGYLAAFGMNVLEGRGFNEDDMRPNRGAMIVNQAFVRAFMAGRDPLTVQVRSGSNTGSLPWGSVVGVVGDRRHSKLEETPRPEFYQPYSPSYDTANLHFAVRSRLPASQVASAARIALRQLDPELALDDLRTMDQRMAEANSRRRFQTSLLSAFGLLAMILALGGIYGVLSYSVRQRTKELGLRMALGAERVHIVAMVLKQGLAPVVLGLMLGLIAALAFTRFIRSWLYNVAPTDPITYLLLSTFILFVATIACLVPASDATKVDPVNAIRNE